MASGYPGYVRIIGGAWRGRRLPVPVAEGLRPTPDRVRETLFNWLAPYLPGARCLDLFAGTGALCLEALSRGAREVVMVEKSARVAAALHRNVQMLSARGAQIIEADAVQFLQRALPGAPIKGFDVIFVDPPFRSGLVGRCATLIEQGHWVEDGGLVYIEAPSRLQPLPVPDRWELIRTKKAGQVGYHLLLCGGTA